MTQTDEIRQVQDAARTVRQNIGRVIVGKEEVVDQLMVALLCEGHVLFEDVPGIGKTTLAKAFGEASCAKASISSAACGCTEPIRRRAASHRASSRASSR